MPFYVELPDFGGVRRRTPRVPWVVAGEVREAMLHISYPAALAGSRPAGEWVPVPGPVRMMSDATWVRLLIAAGETEAAARGRETLSPLERAELEGGGA